MKTIYITIRDELLDAINQLTEVLNKQAGIDIKDMGVLFDSVIMTISLMMIKDSTILYNLTGMLTTINQYYKIKEDGEKNKDDQ